MPTYLIMKYPYQATALLGWIETVMEAVLLCTLKIDHINYNILHEGPSDLEFIFVHSVYVITNHYI